MDWVTLLVPGLFALAWLIAVFRSWNEEWETRKTVGVIVFLGGATGGVFLDDFLTAESPLLLWIEPVAAVIMLVGMFVAWIWIPEENNRSANDN